MFNLISCRKPQRNEIARFRSETDDFFKRFFDISPFDKRSLFSEKAWFPYTDVSEGEKDITVKAEIPGADKEDIDVQVSGRTLTIKGEKKQETKEDNEDYHREERFYGTFRRSIRLPAGADTSDIDASYKNGILNITMKKIKPSAFKKIEISGT
ncbi:Hsp20/alpha crystallin family protein [Desulfonema magnum]|uniref:Heat shock protein, Hsp 20 family n=1 Tax=Desulfonema magnum TaxID=45655 RepID=A0A975BRB7_9BACT|nr:Hsp20/alpha crystallin family protein [Desulfonema magnum]QTA90155.1 Heat shock protein, Hsp 20 family [Desulfonema magnum]